MDDDSQLFANYAREGDVSSLSALVARHARWMLALLNGMLPSASDADDAFQEAWRRVIRGAAGFRGGSVKAYLSRAARSAAIDFLRRSGRTVSLDAMAGDGDGPAAEIADAAPTPAARFAFRADAAAVRAAVRELPEGPRQVLLLRVEGGLPFKEIAAELGIPLGTALTWMHAATERLKRKFSERT